MSKKQRSDRGLGKKTALVPWRELHGCPFLSAGDSGQWPPPAPLERKGQCEPCPRGESHFLFNS